MSRAADSDSAGESIIHSIPDWTETSNVSCVGSNGRGRAAMSCCCVCCGCACVCGWLLLFEDGLLVRG